MGGEDEFSETTENDSVMTSMCVYRHLHPSLPQLSYKQKLVCTQRQSWYALYTKTETELTQTGMHTKTEA